MSYKVCKVGKFIKLERGWRIMLLGVTSPVYAIEFNKIMNGIMDEGKLQKNQLADYDDNPVCKIEGEDVSRYDFGMTKGIIDIIKI